MQRAVVGLGVLWLLAAVVPAGAQPLRRDLDAYFVLGLKEGRLKNLTLTSACNVGVDCAATSVHGPCGRLSFDDVSLASGSQAAGDQVSCSAPGAAVHQLFANAPSGGCATITLAVPPILPIDPLPIIPGTCDATCTPNVAALEALCGFPSPFPGCDPAKGVTAKAGEDCNAFDTVPGNGRCDLGPGVYGAVTVRNQAKLELAPGTYSLCNFRVARKALVVAPGVDITIPAGGEFRVGGQSSVGQRCGDLNVLIQGTGGAVFGRNAVVGAKVCAPAGDIRLGHGNTLLGRFVADVVLSNRDNRGECCGGHCACVDAFAPLIASVGDTITLTGGCDLNQVTGVSICGLAASFVKSSTQIQAIVPAGANGACAVRVDSAAGSYVASALLSVS